MRSIVRKILSASRFALDVHEAAEGIAALNQLRSGNFGLVFLDYNMPGFNGLETLSEIKRESPNVAVVMMTSTVDNAIADRAHAAGALAFLKKPFYPADIDAVLERYYGLHVPAVTERRSEGVRSGVTAGLLEREFAVADAGAEAFGEGGRRFLAIGGDEFGQRGEQAGLRQAIAVDAVEARFGPGFLQVAERHALLLVVRHRLARVSGSPRCRHCHLRPRAPGSRTPSQIPTRTLARGRGRT